MLPWPEKISHFPIQATPKLLNHQLQNQSVLFFAQVHALVLVVLTSRLLVLPYVSDFQEMFELSLCCHRCQFNISFITVFQGVNLNRN